MDKCPDKSFAILEARENMGGTWDLFKYPGIRSDSDMYTLGFSFNPWVDAKSIADGPSILQYIKDTAAKFGIDKKILFNHRVIDASWSDEDKFWTIKINCAGIEKLITCNFIFSCSGYYDYNKGYEPEFPGIENFKGIKIHPQKWTEDLSYENKKIIVIGSGATAVTLVPELSKKAAKVTMLQRSPTYIMSLPRKDKLAERIKKIFSPKTAYRLIRWKNIRIGQWFYQACQRWPNMMKKYILKKAKAQLSEDFDMRHFEPSYGPWDQRLCVVPNGDLFKSLKNGKSEIVTDRIKNFSESGILLESGKELEADIIVSATGLKLQLLGGMTMHINGVLANPKDIHCYKGVMFSGIPNFAVAIGYTNASWTLKCDLSCYYVTRILNYMKQNNYEVCVPKFNAEEFNSEPLLDFDAGYVKRAVNELPKQGSKAPWKLYQNYFKDAYTLKKAKAVDKYLEFK
jgi:cation diffusion facilitator CzcD-associated flavoprotein CzcO